jgi:hypothetical protein
MLELERGLDGDRAGEVDQKLENKPKMEAAGVETSTVVMSLLLSLSLSCGGGGGGTANARGISFTPTEVSTTPQKRKRAAGGHVGVAWTNTKPTERTRRALLALAFDAPLFALPSNRILCRCAHVLALASFERSTRECECEWTVSVSRISLKSLKSCRDRDRDRDRRPTLPESPIDVKLS